MADIRYVGNTAWSRTVLNDKGEPGKPQIVQPGETISVSEEAADKLAGPHTPLHLRVFVKAGSSEDPQSRDYQAGRYAAVSGNATPYPELDMGSTVQGGRTITRTEDDNPEGFPLGDPTQGPQSDNADLMLREEAQQEADKAYKSKREEQAKARQSGRQGQGQPQRQAERKSEG